MIIEMISNWYNSIQIDVRLLAEHSEFLFLLFICTFSVIIIREGLENCTDEVESKID